MLTIHPAVFIIGVYYGGKGGGSVKKDTETEITEQESCRYTFFQHKECEYFPCHKTKDPENFNCLFCYCPLYALGSKCGGKFVYLENGYKDCSGCLRPHGRNSYSMIKKKYGEIVELAKENK